jgi:hypothetical protein
VVSIESRFLHTLVVKRLAPTGAQDDYLQPVRAETTLATVPGLIQPRAQPRAGQEVIQADSAGVALAEYIGFLRPLPGLDTDCWIEHAGNRYDIVSIADAGGVGHHLECFLREVH